MALKSKEWFYKKCLQEIEKHGRFSHLCWDILKKGIGQSDSTRGHVNQAIGVCQKFLGAHRKLSETIQAADPTRPFNISGNPVVRNAFRTWLVRDYARHCETDVGQTSVFIGGRASSTRRRRIRSFDPGYSGTIRDPSR